MTGGAYKASSGGDAVAHVQVRDATPDAAAVVEVHEKRHAAIQKIDAKLGLGTAA